MEKWLKPALDYIDHWLQFQMRRTEQPGCVIAIAHKGRVVFEQAYGVANLDKRTPLTPRHRFRVASHSKSFTAAAIMKLREQKKLRLDDAVGDYVDGLHPDIAQATIAQLLSHSAGITRDGPHAAFWLDVDQFLRPARLKKELQAPPVIEPNTRFKYSNHGYGLLGLVIEAATGEPYAAWVKREIVDAAGLAETVPDMPLQKGSKLADGHSGRQLLGVRVVIPGDHSTHAQGAAAGFISTAADLVRFYRLLAPATKQSILSVGSRREMFRRHWRNIDPTVEGYYGLGISSGTIAGWDCYGHGGGFNGYITRTSILPEPDLAISVLTNAIDGFAPLWHDGAIQILKQFAQHGAPAARIKHWGGRWATMWSSIDLVPMGDKVFLANPALFNPFMGGAQVRVVRGDDGVLAVDGGYGNYGEVVRLVRDNKRRVRKVWLGGVQFLPEQTVARHLRTRFGSRNQVFKEE